MDISDEIRTAIGAKLQVTPGCCIAFNPLISKLRRHGHRFVPAFEQVSQDVAKEKDIRRPPLRSYMSELFAIYFAIADENEIECDLFVATLSEELFNSATLGIQTVWGTNNNDRRTVISKSLFEVLSQKLDPDHPLLVTLNRLLKIGQLTFDRTNPGKRAPLRKLDLDQWTSEHFKLPP